MMAEYYAPCELVLKIGSNESEEISTAVTSLLRACSMPEQNFFFVEHQIQPTAYFGAFSSESSLGQVPIQCQALSCVLFPIDPMMTINEKNHCFKSIDFWHFHHKIELLNEYQHVIARQDYYELSHQLPLWSVSHVPKNRRLCVRFNIFTGHFDTMLAFYTRLFQRSPSSSKPGFVLFTLPSKNHIHYQLSIKSSPSIHPYSISHGAQLKFRLTDLSQFMQEYSRKLFTLNPSEYYVYDPDGNLLHLHVSPSFSPSTRRESIIPIHDSGIGDTSDPSLPLLNVTRHPCNSSNDSGRWSSISSTEMPPIRRTRNKKPTVYQSVPRLFPERCKDARTYSSMTDVQRLQQSRPRSTHHFGSKKPLPDPSYDVDGQTSTYGYLQAYLQRKQQSTGPVSVKQLVAQFEGTKALRPVSVPLVDQLTSPRINIGITLDSRLRKTPVLDMLRSTTMESLVTESFFLKRTNSLKPSVSIARF